MAYIEQTAKEQGCIFCTKFRSDDLRDGLVLTHTARSVVMLNKYPYNNGHLLIAPKRHESSLVRPGGINLGMNLGKCAGAGIEDHLHWHIVPRWEGDTNFMPVVAETRVMPQHLLDSYDRLRPLFQNLSA